MAGIRLRRFALALIVLNVIATIVAVVVNWPAQFGRVGTDAGREFLLGGTAISAPLLPMVLFIVVFATAGRSGGWGYVGIAAAYLAAVTVTIGGIGEMVAEPTADTPQTVLTMAGIVWVSIAVVLAALATAALLERRNGGRAASIT